MAATADVEDETVAAASEEPCMENGLFAVEPDVVAALNVVACPAGYWQPVHSVHEKHREDQMVEKDSTTAEPEVAGAVEVVVLPAGY